MEERATTTAQEGYADADRLSSGVTRGMDVLDSLTGVFHRAYLEAMLPEAMSSCRKHGQSFSLIYADIDRFSQINERYGSVAGDLVLQHVAQTLQKRTARPESWVARDHADALVICLPGVKNSVARRLAGNLRVAVASERLPLKGGEITTTCSFVVLSVEREEELPSAQELLRQARKRAALAKESGGNIVL
jgi:diguanylate cyclase (GGDEF)-like protein